MSFRARMQRIAFIHRRLKHKRDYPSARRLAEDYLEETGDEFSERTFKRDIEWLRDEQAPIEYDARRHGYYYADETFELPTVMLTEGDLLAVLVTERALAAYRNSPYYERLRSVFDRLTSLLPAELREQAAAWMEAAAARYRGLSDEEADAYLRRHDDERDHGRSRR
jgi:predicted DNA-binding transcriptional regulator YafY